MKCLKALNLVNSFQLSIQIKRIPNNVIINPVKTIATTIGWAACFNQAIRQYDSTANQTELTSLKFWKCIHVFAHTQNVFYSLLMNDKNTHTQSEREERERERRINLHAFFTLFLGDRRLIQAKPRRGSSGATSTWCQVPGTRCKPRQVVWPTSVDTFWFWMGLH